MFFSIKRSFYRILSLTLSQQATAYHCIIGSKEYEKSFNRFFLPRSVVHGVCTELLHKRQCYTRISVPSYRKGNQHRVLLLQRRVDCSFY